MLSLKVYHLLKNLIPKQRMVTTPQQLADAVLPERELTNDYVRLATLELLCRQLQGVPGAAAELGVYRGFFARCINRLLPERKLYLFDSFEGFSSDAGASDSFQAAHRNTAVEKVLGIVGMQGSQHKFPGRSAVFLAQTGTRGLSDAPRLGQPQSDRGEAGTF